MDLITANIDSHTTRTIQTILVTGVSTTTKRNKMKKRRDKSQVTTRYGNRSERRRHPHRSPNTLPFGLQAMCLLPLLLRNLRISNSCHSKRKKTRVVLGAASVSLCDSTRLHLLFYVFFLSASSCGLANIPLLLTLFQFHSFRPYAFAS